MTKKVMIANYDPNVLMQQKKAFEGMDVELKTVKNGDSALAEFADFQPDMVLLDPMLPKVSGFDVAQKIRALMPDLPIVMLTSVYRGLVYRTQALDKYGATEYLEEPVSVEELRATIEKYIGSPVQGPGSKKQRISSKRRFEELLQDTKGDSKPQKRKKTRAKAKVKVETATGKPELKSNRSVDAKRKSTRKKLEAILKESHVH